MTPVTEVTEVTEVADILHRLLRIDTSNPGQVERPAAEAVAELLTEVGIECRLLEGFPGRTNLIARIPGRDPSRGALLIHGHLDVVPAVASEWTVHPFSGELRDGFLWGRGAVDMKDMIAMVVTVLRHWARTGVQPDRDLVIAFMADEELGSVTGARWLVAEHPEIFADCTEAIGEVGGFSVSLNDQARLYLVQCAEKGLAWLRLRATGRPGHGAMIHPGNAVTHLASAVSRIGSHEFPAHLLPEVATLLRELQPLVGMELDPQRSDQWLPALGGLARAVGASLRNTANPTRFDAGYQHNVVPSTAEAIIDTRFLPGFEDELMHQVAELAGPDVDIEVLVHGVAVQTSFDGALVDAMCAGLRAQDPHAIPVPYLLTGGTDAKVFAPLGIRCFGFCPLQLPADLDFSALFHGIDERVPVDALEFGVRTLDQVLSTC